MHLDPAVCYRAVHSRDTRFDGRFSTGVTTTGVYCRPSCPARTPLRHNVRFFANAVTAECAGFRACRRCRSEVSPDAPDWDIRSDLVGRALRLIAEGVVDRDGVRGLARRLAVGERHLHRLFVSQVGARPSAVARTRRAQLGRQLLDQTGLPVTQVAYAAGFASLRQFNAVIRAAYGATPTQLRAGRGPVGGQVLTLRLGYRPPLAVPELLAFLAARAVPGVEEVVGGVYRRTVMNGGIPGLLELEPDLARGTVLLRLHADGLTGVAATVQRSRVLFDLDADPASIGAVLCADPLLAPLVEARPGLRLPGAFDAFEFAVRAVLGQQVSVAAARTFAGRIAERAGRRSSPASATLTLLFPTSAELAEADLAGLGLTGRRVASLRALSCAVAGGEVVLDASADPAETSAALLRIPGIGPWTVALIALRALRDPDALPAGDLGLLRALEPLRRPRDPAWTPERVRARAERWRPWRGYGVMHLWVAAFRDPAGRMSEVA